MAAPAAIEDAFTAGVMAKMDALAERLVDLRAMGTLGQQVQVREAQARSELTLALTEALAGRAEVQARLRAEALRRLGERARPGRRRSRLARGLNRVLVRLGSIGQAAVIARSGLWRGVGRPFFDLRHMAAYARRRGDAGVIPPAPVHQGWYLEAYPDARGLAPLAHYLALGAAQGRAPHPLFDPAWYAQQNPDAATSGLTPLEHFVHEGAARGRNPHPLFDVAHYLAQGPDLAPGEDPALHYLRTGWEQGLSPHPLFDPTWYGEQAQGAAIGPPLLHYLAEGWRAGLSPHPLFGPRWYLEQNPDIAATGAEPLGHFAAIGGAEGRSPSPWFDCAHYMALRGEALAAGANPLVDYLQGGAWEITEPRPGFPTAAYLAANPALVRSGLTPLEHWARRAG